MMPRQRFPARDKTACVSSFFATATGRLALHFSHWWMIRYFGVVPSSRIGSIMPPHTALLSPGSISTCLLQRHCGQWLVYPSPVTWVPQCSQTKSSIVRLKLIPNQHHCTKVAAVRWICAPEAEVQESVKTSEPTGVDWLVGMILEPSFFTAITFVPIRRAHGMSALMPTEDHATVIGFPRETSFGCVMMVAMACEEVAVEVPRACCSCCTTE